MYRFNSSWICVLLMVCLSLTGQLRAQQIDEEYNRKIKEYTTDARFLPPSVLDLVAHPTVPSPLKHFGEIVGTPGRQFNVEEIHGYFAALAASSPFVHMEEIGRSEEDRPLYVIAVADEETISKLDYYKGQLARLADPRKVTVEEAPDVIAKSKMVYHLNGGLHNPETGSPQMLMELAYRLATGDNREIRDIRDNMITTIIPIAEPDGWARQTDWYNRYTKHYTEYDDVPMRNPPYWGKYIVHDNNRDGLQVTAELTKAIYRYYFDWHPTVFLDLHESVPLLYISTGTGPYNDSVDPITINEWQLLASQEMTQLAAEGLPGVFTWAFYDGWYPGYLAWLAINHNSNARFYETFGNAGSNTYLRDLTTRNFTGDPVTSRQWYRPYPATDKVLWSFRNNINYMQAGVLATLGYAAANSKQLLSNFYKKGLNSFKQGLAESGSRMFVIPSGQRDPDMVAYLVNQLRVQEIEVHEVVSGSEKGAYAVLLDQPYRNLAVNLLTNQKFPKDAQHAPYDDVAWTFGLMYGVEVEERKESLIDRKYLKLVESDVKYQGSVSGRGNIYLLDYKAQAKVLPALYKLKAEEKNIQFELLQQESSIGSQRFGKGSIVVKGASSEQIAAAASSFGLDFVALSKDMDAERSPITLPRIAIYHTWYNTQDEGWVRYTFDELGIPYSSIHKDHVKEGNLNSQFDVILIPKVRGTASQFVLGIDSKYGPMPYTKTDEYPSHGTPSTTDDMTGGPGFLGIAELQKFTEQGGVLIPLENSAAIVAELGFARELSTHNTNRLFHPGSIVRTKVRNTGSPIMYGYPEVMHVLKGNGPLLRVSKNNLSYMVLQYGAQRSKLDAPYEGEIMGGIVEPVIDQEKYEEKYPLSKYPYLISGMVRNEEEILGQGAIFNVPVGAGRIVAFTFNPLHRFQNHYNAPMVWNTLINWDKLSE